MLDPVKIPQNIYVEDRIIGPVSLRQLMIIMIGGGISYVIWSMVKAANDGYSSAITTTISWLPAGIAAAFAFVKVHHCSLLKLCLLFLEKFDKPNIRVWLPRRGITLDIQSYFNIQSAANNISSKQKKYSEEVRDRKQLKELSQILDTNTQYDQVVPAQKTEPAATAPVANPAETNPPSQPPPTPENTTEAPLTQTTNGNQQ